MVPEGINLHFWLEWLMPRTHGANKPIIFAQVLYPHEVTLLEFAQINDASFTHVYKIV